MSRHANNVITNGLYRIQFYSKTATIDVQQIDTHTNWTVQVWIAKEVIKMEVLQKEVNRSNYEVLDSKDADTNTQKLKRQSQIA